MTHSRQPFAATALASVALAVAGQASAQQATQAAPTTEKGRVGYAIGLDIGRSLKPMQEEFDLAAIKLAIDDVLAGRESRLSDEQLKTTMETFAAKMQERQKAEQARVQAEQAEQAKANSAAGAAFLAENGKKPGVITTASGLQYQVLKAAEGKKPTAQQMVTVHYTGTLLDGTKFDSSRDRNEPSSFVLDQVIPGWTEGVQLMSVGSSYRFWIPAPLAYGEMGTPGGPIPPGSTLVFDVELVEIK